MNGYYAILAIMIATLFGCVHKSEPATQPANRASTQPVLQAISLRYSHYLSRTEIHTEIAPDGSLQSHVIHNKSYGPNDRVMEWAETYSGVLTFEEKNELAALFSNWDSFSSDKYGSAADSPDIEIRYGDKTASGGSETPDQVWKIATRINEIAKTKVMTGIVN